MTAARAAGLIRERLGAVTDEGETEARAMVCALMGAEYRDYLKIAWEPFPGECWGELCRMAAERERGEPLQYILGEWEFMGLPFYTRPCALIPRQDTETLCEEAVKIGGGSVLDLCCGTGCIGVALARRASMEAAFSDISPECAALARINAERNGVKGVFFVGDLFENVRGRYSPICCNPPYISRGEIPSLQPEVRREPLLALDGGEDGLDFYRRIAAAYRDFLRPGGRMLLEAGAGQAGAVMDIFGGGYAVKDLRGIERAIVI